MKGTGQVIKELRKTKKLTQEELAERLGVNKSCIQKYQNSTIINLKLDKIRKLCELFQVPPYVFIFPNMWDIATIKNEKFKEHITFHTKYINLSEDGRKKVLEYIEDILENPKYKGTTRYEENDALKAIYTVHYHVITEYENAPNNTFE